MQVDDAVERLLPVLLLYPVTDRAEVVAEVLVTGRLYAAESPRQRPIPVVLVQGFLPWSRKVAADPPLPLRRPYNTGVSFGLLPLLQTDPVVFVLLAASLVGAISLHEFAHAFVADLQGDRLPRAMGRISLNPARHLDPVGTICLVLLGFGWGKPVEFRPSALASRRFGAALVALAGPTMNLLLGVAAIFLLALVNPVGTGRTFLDIFAYINILLAVFNLIPLPPLDGSRLLTIFLPPGRQHILFFLDKYGFLILLALVFFGGFSFISPIVEAVRAWVTSVAGG